MAQWMSLGAKLPTSRASRLQSVMDGRLGTHRIARHPALRVGLGIEGYQNYVFGCRWGPDVVVDALCHELAHAVEFGPDAFSERCSPLGGFVFREKRVFSYGRFVTETTTGQITERECRATGIAFIIMQAFGMKRDFESYASSHVSTMGFNPDWIVYHKKEQALQDLIRDGRGMYSNAEVFDRLEGWLDLTALRLREEEIHESKTS